MVLGSRLDGGSQVISVRIRKTIQSIKEIVGNHSDADIYAMLKETNMDPNETTQKLLNQDPFHEVKRKRDKKKEHTGYRGYVDTRKHVEHSAPWTKSYTSWDRTARRGGDSRNPAPDAGISREFRIVRDNRVNQNSNKDVKLESIQHLTSANEQVKSNAPEWSSSVVPNDQKRSTATNFERHACSQVVSEPHGSGSSSAKDAGSSGSSRSLLPEEAHKSVSTLQAQKEVQSNSQTHLKMTPNNSAIGVYSSSSDPVHVPSPDSRSAGTVGTIRREVGVVGVRRQSSDRPVTHSSANSSFSVPTLGKNMATPIESAALSAATAKSSQFNQTSDSDPILPGMSVSRSFSAGQHMSKVHQQPVGHQKAMQPNMEWKPKSSQKTTVVSSAVIGVASASPSSHADNLTSSNPVDMPVLSEKLSQVSILDTQHVIIPQHLRVPESECTRLTFGSFGAGFDYGMQFSSAFQASENAEESNHEPSASTSAAVPVGSNEDDSAIDPGGVMDGQTRTSRSDGTSTAESEEPQPGISESLSPQNIDNYADIGLVQSHSPPYSSPEPQQLQNQTNLPSFSAYDPQASYDVPFFRTAIEDNIYMQTGASSSEAFSSHAASSNLLSTMGMAQQQQQQVAQMYPQVHISHFPNFVPYRHIFSPVYVPPMAVPNYSSNPPYPHPPNGNSYLLMPGGNSHITASNVKYAASQYKPVPAGSPTGYGNYTNPTGFTIGSPGTVGNATGLEDVSRIKYKDNGLFVPNQQAETSDIWIQTPREVPRLQSAPYYNLSGQAPHAAFMPTHAGHASFNAAAQSSHVQYPGLYHPPQPASMASPHHLVHQQVPSALGGNVGVGVATPGPQVGTFQQPQLGHLNWTANF